jgi:hypothetical protein
MINQSCNNTELPLGPTDGRPILLLSCLMSEPLNSKKTLNVGNISRQFNLRTEFIAVAGYWVLCNEL